MIRARTLALVIGAALAVQSARLCAQPIPARDPGAGLSPPASSPRSGPRGAAGSTGGSTAEEPPIPSVHGNAIGTTTYAPPDPPKPEPQRTAWHAVYFECLGPGVIYSINYERMFDERWSLRVGLGAIAPVVTVPILLNASFGSMDHKLELGAGITIVDFYKNTELAGVGAIAIGVAGAGYRYVPRDGGLFFRVGLNAMVLPGASMMVLPWAGLGVGAML